MCTLWHWICDFNLQFYMLFLISYLFMHNLSICLSTPDEYKRILSRICLLYMETISSDLCHDTSIWTYHKLIYTFVYTKKYKLGISESLFVSLLFGWKCREKKKMKHQAGIIASLASLNQIMSDNDEIVKSSARCQ